MPAVVRHMVKREAVAQKTALPAGAGGAAASFWGMTHGSRVRRQRGAENLMEAAGVSRFPSNEHTR